MKKRQPEHELQVSIVNFAAQFMPLARVSAIPNGGFRRPQEAKALKAAGVRAGVCDLLTEWYPAGKLHGRHGWIELKYDSRKTMQSTENDAWLMKQLEPPQEEFIEGCCVLHIPYAVCSSLDQVVRVWTSWGVPILPHHFQWQE